MGQAWRDGLGEGSDQGFDTIGNFPQPLHMLFGVPPALFVGNDFQPFSQGFGQFVFRFRHRFEEKLWLDERKLVPPFLLIIVTKESLKLSAI